jgi:hypothetical protein
LSQGKGSVQSIEKISSSTVSDFGLFAYDKLLVLRSQATNFIMHSHFHVLKLYLTSSYPSNSSYVSIQRVDVDNGTIECECHVR